MAPSGTNVLSTTNVVDGAVSNVLPESAGSEIIKPSTSFNITNANFNTARIIKGILRSIQRVPLITKTHLQPGEPFALHVGKRFAADIPHESLAVVVDELLMRSLAAGDVVEEQVVFTRPDINALPA